MEYILVVKSTPNELQEEVNEMMKNGWMPIGGGSICFYPVGYRQNEYGNTEIEGDMEYVQSMTRGGE